MQDKENNGTDGVNKFQSVEEEEEEEKEQCSPVSVLDPPFEYDDDGHENDDEDGRFDLECSYANVQSMSFNFFILYILFYCMVVFHQHKYTIVHVYSKLIVRCKVLP